jgi:hypothetical protein
MSPFTVVGLLGGGGSNAATTVGIQKEVVGLITYRRS